MQKDEFEKQVQQNMEELKINPSEVVWTKIESKIYKEKRRKWLIIIFPLMLLCLLLAGYELWYAPLSSKKGQQLTKINVEADKTPETKSINKENPDTKSTTGSIQKNNLVSPNNKNKNITPPLVNTNSGKIVNHAGQELKFIYLPVIRRQR